MEINEIVKGCKKKVPSAQRLLYDHYKGILYAICKRYIAIDNEAEDVFIEGFYKILTKIDQFNDQGSFEGWMKRIMVNEALMHLRSNRMKFVDVGDLQLVETFKTEAFELEMDGERIVELMSELPTGYRTILNMYAVEGYKHREIAEILNISINTSKSQLILAKKRMQEILLNNLNITSENYGR